VIGALTTHRDLAERLAADGPLAALARAAATSAFPAVRNVATVGGNLCAGPFPEADLVPALLALDAEVEVAGPGGRSRRPVQAVLDERPARGELVVAVHVPAPAGRHSGFERLTVRGGGEYALASIALSVDLAPDGTVAAARVAVGAVEHRARRCPAAEAALTGRRLDDEAVDAAGHAAAGELESRDGVDAPGWYRLAVLPALARRAAAAITTRAPA
jgi:carbon-monoxide dehydrogenase medium subunit